MKIGNQIDTVQADLLARATNGSRTPSASTQEVGPVADGDKVELSKTTLGLAAGAAAAGDEALRSEKVAEIRRAIQEGRYHVSAEAVADKMIAQAAELIEAMATGRDAGKGN